MGEFQDGCRQTQPQTRSRSFFLLASRRNTCSITSWWPSTFQGFEWRRWTVSKCAITETFVSNARMFVPKCVKNLQLRSQRHRKNENFGLKLFVWRNADAIEKFWRRKNFLTESNYGVHGWDYKIYKRRRLKKRGEKIVMSRRLCYSNSTN